MDGGAIMALRMESGELRNLGTTIQGNSSSLSTLITNFTNQYQALTANGTWEGPDSTAFATAAGNFATDLQKAADLVNEVGTNLVNTANNYDSCQEEVQGSINNMLG